LATADHIATSIQWSTRFCGAQQCHCYKSHLSLFTSWRTQCRGNRQTGPMSSIKYTVALVKLTGQKSMDYHRRMMMTPSWQSSQ